MKKFKLYQIQLTNEIVDAVNADKTVPAYSAKMKMSIDLRGTNIGNLAGDAFAEEYYTHVSTITAEDFNQVFEIGNIGPESNIERFSRMASISVGDIIVDDEGTMVVVAPTGFVAFAYFPKLAA